jgi:hypothetical protein
VYIVNFSFYSFDTQNCSRFLKLHWNVIGIFSGKEPKSIALFESHGYLDFVLFLERARLPNNYGTLCAILYLTFFLFVEASQSNGGAGGWPPAN